MNRDEYKQFWGETFGAPDYPPTSGRVITDGEVAAFLVESATERSGKWCDPTYCEVCNAFTSLWWDWMNELPGVTRLKVQRVMREAGVPFPPTPSEEVVIHVVPTSLN